MSLKSQKYSLNQECWSSYFLRRPQNFAKSSPYFWLALHRTKVRWKFRKILWPSQNIWTLQLFASTSRFGGKFIYALHVIGNKLVFSIKFDSNSSSPQLCSVVRLKNGVKSFWSRILSYAPGLWKNRTSDASNFVVSNTLLCLLQNLIHQALRWFEKLK